jgi:precorrin-6y C5,15-methyltransferase (decarboxylating) CbiE subunit
MAMKCGIIIVGCGPGSREYLTPAAKKAVHTANVLVGAQRLLDLFPDASAERIVVSAGLEEVLDRIESVSDGNNVAVLTTGDPGLFSFAKLVVKRFGRERCKIIPGISSVQVAFASIGLDWAEAAIISAHKEDPRDDTILKTAEKIAVLGGRDGSLKWLAEHLSPFDSTSRIFVCEDLTMDDEKVTELTAQELATFRASSRTIVLIVKRSLLS